jgi:stalled ribosome rescue protein Dom34
MNRLDQVGLWIDHRQAVIVTILDQGEEITRITSNMAKHVRYSGASHTQTPTEHDDSAEDKRDRRFHDHLNRYYDEIISRLRGADSILIFGPGEAKGELQKRLEDQKVSKCIVAIGTSDKMTDGQIVAEVRQHFRG